jgi:hypothetical protein
MITGGVLWETKHVFHHFPTYHEKILSGKVVPVLFFNRAPRHKGVVGEWRYSSTHSWPRNYMEVSGQLHAPTTLPPEKELLVPIGQEAGWTPEPSWTRLWEEKFPPRSGTRTPNYPAHSPALANAGMENSKWRQGTIINKKLMIIKVKIKGKVSLCLTKHHAMETYWGSGGIGPRILDLGTRWR